MADEVVVGATKVSLVLTIEDENGVAVDLSGVGSTVKLQGHSGELPDDDLDVAGTLTDAVHGVATWTQLGGSAYVALSDLTTEGIESATYRCRVKYTDAGGLIGYGPAFDLTWVVPPIIPSP